MLQVFALSSFSEWQENVGQENSNFSQVTVFRFYRRATISLVGLQGGKMFRNKCKRRVLTELM